MKNLMLFILIAGIFFLAGAIWRGGDKVNVEQSITGEQKTSSSCDSVQLQNKIDQLELQLQKIRAEMPLLNRSSSSAEKSDAEEPKEENLQPRIEMRISTIEKFVPLSTEQKARLADKFRIELKKYPSGEKPDSEPLEAIIGEDAAKSYRQQVQAAYSRIERIEQEKEILYMARIVSANNQTENLMRQAYEETEVEITKESDETPTPTNPTDRVKAMIAEQKKRDELLAKKMKSILSDDQYQMFVREQAASSGQDMELFHGG